jgi:hypothetical protein
VQEKKALFFGQQTSHSAKQRQAESECPNLRAKVKCPVVDIAYQGRFGRLAVVGLPAKTHMARTANVAVLNWPGRAKRQKGMANMAS